MTFHIDDTAVTLADVRRRIEATDLVPSRACLRVGIGPVMAALDAQGIGTLAQLRDALKTAGRLDAVAQATGIDKQYLTLLRREIEGYFPKPAALRAFDWLPADQIARLERRGIRDVAALHAESGDAQSRAALAASTGVDPDVLDTLSQLADLSRVQWVSPATARWLVEADCRSASALAASDAEELAEALGKANQGNRFFKGRLGMRDVRRLIQAAGHVED